MGAVSALQRVIVAALGWHQGPFLNRLHSLPAVRERLQLLLVKLARPLQHS